MNNASTCTDKITFPQAEHCRKVMDDLKMRGEGVEGVRKNRTMVFWESKACMIIYAGNTKSETETI